MKHEAIKLINKVHGTKHFEPMSLTLDVDEIADLMTKFAQSELEKVRKKNKSDAIAFADYCVFNGYGREFIRLAYDRFLKKN